MRTTFPFKPGDVFFCRGADLRDRIINLFQARKSKDGETRCSHTGIVLDPLGNTFETTPWKTGNLNLGENYAGSDLVVLRWGVMDEARAVYGYSAVHHQMGRIYPYWRLFAQAVGKAGDWHGKGMECCIIAAHFIRAAGYPLRLSNLWEYDTETLHDELRSAPGWSVVLEGSQRAQGYIVG